MDIKFKKLTETAKTPERGSVYAAGYDLFADIKETIMIKPNETVKIGTGLAFELPANTFAGIFARSGLATKEGLRPSNCVGVCDADYRGEYIVAIHNDSNSIRYIQPQQKIAQMILLPFIQMEFIETDELSETMRGDNGFGSTGV